jgi:large subunit ribosomal protein L3
MGRRRINAPRRGSLAYLPRARAARAIGRIRYWPDVKLDKPRILGFVGYKVGMSFMYIIGEVRGNPTFGQEIHSPVTIIETPPMFVAGFRCYSQSSSGLRSVSEVWADKLPKDFERLISLPRKDRAVGEVKPSEVAEVRAILATQPRQAGVGRKKPELLEVKVAGGSIQEQLDYVKGLLGREIDTPQVFEEGQYIDVIGVTKGKGVQGPVKRWGIKRKHHKARKTVRGVGTLGPWTPPYVMYTVPRAGQMGFHQRTEFNKRILKIVANGEEVNPAGGFPHYGKVKKVCIILSGSLPGPPKRTLKLRYAARPPTAEASPPKITLSGVGKVSNM